MKQVTEAGDFEFIIDSLSYAITIKDDYII